MLRACRRVLKPGGRIAYYNIFIPHELAENDRLRWGKESPGRYSRAEQQALLRSAGFARIQETEVTAEYLRVQRALYEANEHHARALRRALGGREFEERQTGRKKTLAGIEAGAFRRSLFVAERPAAMSR